MGRRHHCLAKRTALVPVKEVPHFLMVTLGIKFHEFEGTSHIETTADAPEEVKRCRENRKADATFLPPLLLNKKCPILAGPLTPLTL
jgi:hypothetical protein